MNGEGGGPAGEIFCMFLISYASGAGVLIPMLFALRRLRVKSTDQRVVLSGIDGTAAFVGGIVLNVFSFFAFRWGALFGYLFCAFAFVFWLLSFRITVTVTRASTRVTRSFLFVVPWYTKRREATPHTGPGGAPAQRGADGRGIPRAPARAPVDDAEQRTDRHPLACPQPWLELLKAPVIHADLAAAAALAAAHQHRAASRAEVELTEIERFLDAQPGPPEHRDQPARSVAVQPVAAAAHDRDDLLGAPRVGRVPAALAAEPASCQVARHGSRRPAATERVQWRRSGHGFSQGSSG